MATAYFTAKIGAASSQWIHLIPAGKFTGVDGRGPFHLKHPSAVIATSDAKLVLDENHSTDLAAPQGGAAPARGWITRLQEREDGIWGHVEWTESGKQLLAEKAYRGISPVFDADPKTGEVLRLLRAALTNNPNLTQLAVLHHKGSLKPPSDPLTDEQKRVCKMMGLNEEKFAAQLAPKKDPAAELGLSQQEMEVCRKMNLDPSKFAQQRNKRPTSSDLFYRA